MPHGRPAKRRRLTPPVDDSKTSETIQSADLFHHAADWDLEQDYETRGRRKRAKEKESSRLPIKNVNGIIEQAAQPLELEDAHSDSFLDSDSDAEEPKKDGQVDTPPTEDVDAQPDVPLKVQIIQMQEDIARLATLINEDPEEHSGSFKKLASLTDDKTTPTIQKLVLVSQAAIYKDAAPGYRIRAYKDDEMGTKVSKDVRRTRQYEHALVTGYQNYVRRLVDLCKKKEKEGEGLKTIALNCVSSLLLTIPHFNFRAELLNVIVAELRSKDAGPHFRKSLDTLEKFFGADEDGGPSLEAANLLSKMMKGRDYDIREEVLNSFLNLQLLTQLSIKHSMSHADRPDDISKLHGRKAKKEKWEHRSKKEKKLARERKAVEKDMREADAAVDFEAREKLQSETLKIVFVTYFRILKARVPHLMGAVLEGLAKFAHLINQDFFGDILEALKDIIRQAQGDDPEDDKDNDAHEERDRMRESLLAIQTAFTLLSQQDAAKSASALHLDLSFFTSHVYRSLYTAGTDADIELGPKAMHLPDPHASQTSRRENKVNISTPVLLLTRALSAILLTPSSPPTTPAVAAFFKRLLTISLQTPEKSTKALLTLLASILNRHGKRLEPLWYSDERKGDGLFRPDAATVEATNVFAVGSGVWEQELLRLHYCPEVREQVKEFDKHVMGLAK